MNINTFKKELYLIFSSVVAKVEDSHMIHGTVQINHEDLIRLLVQQVTPNRYIVELKTIDVAAGLGPLFLKLPREIRDMVYERLLASGYPEFLRASRTMHKEATSLVSKYGVYRVNIGFGSKANYPKPTQQLADTVQNLHLRAKVESSQYLNLCVFPEKEILQMFVNSDIGRKSCSVSFEAGFATESLICLKVVDFLKAFKGFEEVTMSVKSDWLDRVFIPDHPFGGQISSIIRARHVNFDLIHTVLRKALGTAYWVQQGAGVQLVFYPRYSDQGKEKIVSARAGRRWRKWKNKKPSSAGDDKSV